MNGTMHNRSTMVYFTHENFERLKQDYHYAKAEGFDSFLFENTRMTLADAEKVIGRLSRITGEDEEE
jgi:hypothetical protein